MDLLAILRIAMRALARNKMRSVLTMLGIIVGVGAVIAMLGVGQGARQTMQEQIQAMGSNLLFVGAGTVVTRDVPNYALIVGNPGRRIGWMCSCGLRLPDVQSEAKCSSSSISRHRTEVHASPHSSNEGRPDPAAKNVASAGVMPFFSTDPRTLPDSLMKTWLLKILLLAPKVGEPTATATPNCAEASHTDASATATGCA